MKWNQDPLKKTLAWLAPPFFLLTVSYELRNEQEWLSRTLGGAAVLAVGLAISRRVDKDIAISVVIPVLEAVERTAHFLRATLTNYTTE